MIIGDNSTAQSEVLRARFQILTERVHSAATTLKMFGEIEDAIELQLDEDSFTLRTGNAWCRLTLYAKQDRVVGTFGWWGPGFEVQAQELFRVNGSAFDNVDVMAEFVIVELLRALTNTSACSPQR